jgi:hypothetical protein
MDILNNIQPILIPPSPISTNINIGVHLSKLPLATITMGTALQREFRLSMCKVHHSSHLRSGTLRRVPQSPAKLKGRCYPHFRTSRTTSNPQAIRVTTVTRNRTRRGPEPEMSTSSTSIIMAEVIKEVALMRPRTVLWALHT